MTQYEKNRALYESIMRSVSKEVKKAINEQEALDEWNLNLFGNKSKDIDLTVKALSTYTPEDLSKVIQEIAIESMANAKGNIEEAVKKMTEKYKEVIEDAKENKENATKLIKGFSDSIASAVKNEVKELPQVILCNISELIIMAAKGIVGAEDAIKSLYSSIAEYATKLYDNISKALSDAKDNLEKGINAVKPYVVLFGKFIAAIGLLIAKGAKGAAEAFSNFITKIVDDAKNKVTIAVCAVKMFLSSKSEEIKAWASKTYADCKDACVEAWKSLNQAAAKAWNSFTESVEEFMNNVKGKIDSAVQKAGELIAAAKDKLISIKDAGANKVITHAVKALNHDNYSLDDVIELVTKAYNESLVISNNQMYLNETRFNILCDKKFALYEAKRF